MKYHYLREPNERDIQEEEFRFENSVEHYLSAERMRKRKLAGCCQWFTMAEIEKCCEHNFNHAVSLTPTVFQIELHELLMDNNICSSYIW